MTIEVGRSGGGIPINTYKAFNDYTVKLTDDSGGQWLRTGYVETNPSVYPNAPSFIEGVQDSIFSTGNRDNPRGCSWDGTNIWIIETTDSVNGFFQMLKFSPAGNLLNTYGGTGLSGPNDSVFDGTHIYVCQSNATVRYNLDGTSGGAVTHPAGVSISAICHDGTFFWVLNGPELLQLDSLFVETGITIELVAGRLVSFNEVTWDGTHFWLGETAGEMHQYTVEGKFTGSWFENTNGSYKVSGMAWDGSLLLVSDQTNDNLIKYDITSNSYVGDPTAELDPDANGRPVYLKVG